MGAIALVSLLTGLSLFLLGRLQLGKLIRYIPYPVIGGFLAGSGWLLVCGALRVMTGRAFNLENLARFLEAGAIQQWLPGVVFGGLLFFVLRRLRHPLMMPLILFAAIGLFYLVLAATGTPLTGARERGWLPNFPTSHGTTVLTNIHSLHQVPWQVLGHEWGIFVMVLLTSVISILLTASALELTAHEEIDLNRELRAAGVATFASGLGGGMVGFHSLSLSRLVLSLGARTRWVGVGSALICGLALFYGPSMASFVPQYVCGGLLFFLGLTFLWEWVYEARRTLTRLDYGVVLLILVVVGAAGYPEGVGVGIIAAVVMFIHNYSRVDVVTEAVSGAELHSNVDRPVRAMRYLREQGAEIYILRLQGFIFFGTADHLLDEVRARADDRTRLPLKFVILDFRRVTGLDSSAVFSLSKVRSLGHKQGFIILMSHLSAEIISQLEKGGLPVNRDDSLKLLPDLDHALEWCENRLLASAPTSADTGPIHLAEQLKDAWPANMEPRQLIPYLERLEMPAGQHLIQQSEQSDSLYFIESGRVTVRLELANGDRLRLRNMGAGTVVGEVGLFLGGARTASVVTEQPCTVYRLSAESLTRMSRENSDLTLAFYRYVICLLGERLASNSRLLRSGR
jgi:SulP family sulfate permease